MITSFDLAVIVKITPLALSFASPILGVVYSLKVPPPESSPTSVGVGCDVGIAVGKAVGRGVTGALVGALVVGAADGSEVGLAEGGGVAGTLVGALVVGAAVGSGVVGALVGDDVVGYCCERRIEAKKSLLDEFGWESCAGKLCSKAHLVCGLRSRRRRRVDT